MQHKVSFRQLRVRPGDLILHAWRRLEVWARQFELRLGPGLTGRVTPYGTIIRARTRKLPPAPFRVSASGQAATIGHGRIENLVPTIGGLRIDGVLDEITRETTDPPELSLEAGPDAEGRSWVGLTVTASVGAPAVPLAVVATHRNDWTGHPLGGSPEEMDASGSVTAFVPLALLLWSGSGRAATLTATVQIVRHHLAAVYISSSTPGGTGRFYFGAK